MSMSQSVRSSRPQLRRVLSATDDRGEGLSEADLETEDMRQEFGGSPVVPGGNDGVVQLD